MRSSNNFFCAAVSPAWSAVICRIAFFAVLSRRCNTCPCISPVFKNRKPTIAIHEWHVHSIFENIIENHLVLRIRISLYICFMSKKEGHRKYHNQMLAYVIAWQNKQQYCILFYKKFKYFGTSQTIIRCSNIFKYPHKTAQYFIWFSKRFKYVQQNLNIS